MAPHRPLSHISSAPTYKRLRRPVPISFYRNAVPGQASSLFHACRRTTKRLPHAHCVHAVAPLPRPLCARSLLPTTERPRPHSPYSTLSTLHQLPAARHAVPCRLSHLVIMTITFTMTSCMHRHSSPWHVSALTVTSPAAQGHAPAVPTFFHTHQDRCALPAITVRLRSFFSSRHPALMPLRPSHPAALQQSGPFAPPPPARVQTFVCTAYSMLPGDLALHFVHTGHVKPAATTSAGISLFRSGRSLAMVGGGCHACQQICVGILHCRRVNLSVQGKG